MHRPVAALCAVLLVPALAACGGTDDTSGSPATASESSAGASTTGELSEVSFSGDVGESLKATWSSKVEEPESTTVTTLVKGTGDAVADGDTVSTFLWVGNGSTKKDVYSDYDNGAPEAIANGEELSDVFRKLFAGATYGSRVAAVTTAPELFGASAENNQLGVGATDTLVIVADLVEKQEESPTPTDDTAHDASPDTQPSVVEESGKPTGLDFSGIEEPALDTPVQRVVIEEGTGAAVKDSDTVKVNYLGATYDAAQPFDESFSGQPLTSPLSGLIQGWTIGLTGVKVGSRVLLQIPPAYGYGPQGSGAIPGNATLWFVIDVLAVQ
jgi:peptidylprolyl isomerase